MILSNYISSSISNAIRTVKVYCFGSNDVRTATQYSPAGFDSSPISGMKAIYAKTARSTEPVVIGYLIKSEVEDGESKIFSFDKNGDKAYVKCNLNDEVELNGNTDYAVLYNKLLADIATFNASLTAELSLIASGIATGGGAYTPTGLNIDITDTKAEKVRL